MGRELKKKKGKEMVNVMNSLMTREYFAVALSSSRAAAQLLVNEAI